MPLLLVGIYCGVTVLGLYWLWKACSEDVNLWEDDADNGHVQCNRILMALLTTIFLPPLVCATFFLLAEFGCLVKPYL
jgi:hypothetical protein